MQRDTVPDSKPSIAPGQAWRTIEPDSGLSPGTGPPRAARARGMRARPARARDLFPPALESGHASGPRRPPAVRLVAALRRARGPILLLAAVYAASLTTGAVMVHTGNRGALAFRDSLVARAHRRDPSALADDANHPVRAAALDFARNLGMAAVPETVGGLLLVLPPVLAAYRGWVGGIVSVEHDRSSRLARWRSALQYLVTLALQLAAFTLAGGAGLHLGWCYFRRRGPFVGPAWFRLPGPALVDVVWLYALVVPLFAIGSLWEFCSPLR